ncbi:hypothetical protein Mal4_00060 [Maioricimonas rarisocia]|uniref:DUF1552 domain-containing protein n=1 Tax=Maioricimonas rarisocia TaxID=2528026 RepID=A0A517YZR0_9PLAN|nr:DUF1552 domain-containing protein [Maioricimonas rarisocia]QDU35724.1 hypothetical protein Mal4_00060 [Maioricimonas rarisocia]
MHQFSRRTLLRGVGGSMALPWLESLSVWANDQTPLRQASEAPRRFAVLFAGNGFHKDHWWARGAGTEMALGQVLAPLQAHREKVLFIRGLYNEQALKGNIHSSQTGNLLSGAPLASGGEIRSGTSIDQVLAQTHGRSTKVPSLVLGCEKSNPSVHKNYSMLYSSHISWSSPTTPTPLELYPALAFDRLFRDTADAGDRSVLDAVLEDARRLRSGVSRSDQQKLDEYLNSVREVEQRIERAGTRGELQGWRPTLEKPDIPRPADGIPQDIGEHMRLMCDILVLAFQTDTTRICTLKLNNDHSALRFPNLGVDYMIHHLLSHQESDDWLKVNQFFVQQLAYIADRLDAIQEGEKTALDNSMLMFCSSMLTGSHNAGQLPVILVGRGGGSLETGRTLDYLDQPNRKMCSLYLSLLDKFGVHLEEFGDSRERLPGV